MPFINCFDSSRAKASVVQLMTLFGKKSIKKYIATINLKMDLDSVIILVAVKLFKLPTLLIDSGNNIISLAPNKASYLLKNSILKLHSYAVLTHRQDLGDGETPSAFDNQRATS